MQLSAREVSFCYQPEQWLFQGMNLVIDPGEIVGLIGPSGSGKTTFCKLLAGYETPVAGEVYLGGKSLSNKGYHPVQLVYQHPEKAVNPHWKMKRIVSEGWNPDKETLDLLGIEQEWLERWPNELSGGELQRFCVARALGPETRFLIADEMTTMLDAITQAQLWTVLQNIARERMMGMLVVSHEKSLIQRVCHRVVEMKRAF
ncbi:ABC transporter ATP-binding protein [Metabacillus malikii]|uniref:Peptide/nickel transport system ATP-binding protein n=1 Tax=Metabacillus malikii TaxID=1504265 RepID=A0ABT9ZLA8_9BACI|nr:ATP-binding cassette domain-containing protein [Metabacillus malikii]MDQ0233068.1 peptide/nickel transport system ATP-binding protein [Metabacillus malikii]